MRLLFFILSMSFSITCFGGKDLTAALGITNINGVLYSATNVEHICHARETVPSSPALQSHVIITSNKKYRVYVVTAGNPKGQPLLFVHGSPGDWEMWRKYLSDPRLSSKYYLIAYDRPGYGNTTPKELATSHLEEQANIVSDILHVLAPGRPATVIAHSFGGAIATKFALMHPNLVKSLMLLAPALNPNTEDHSYYRAANNPLFRKLAGFFNQADFATSARESVPLPEELRKLTAELPRLSQLPISIFQGKSDAVVHPKTPNYFMRMIGKANKTAVHYIEGQGHLIPHELPNFVTINLLHFLETGLP